MRKPKLVTIDKKMFMEVLRDLRGPGRAKDYFERSYRNALLDVERAFDSLAKGDAYINGQWIDAEPPK